MWIQPPYHPKRFAPARSQPRSSIVSVSILLLVKLVVEKKREFNSTLRQTTNRLWAAACCRNKDLGCCGHEPCAHARKKQNVSDFLFRLSVGTNLKPQILRGQWRGGVCVVVLNLSEGLMEHVWKLLFVHADNLPVWITVAITSFRLRRGRCDKTPILEFYWSENGPLGPTESLAVVRLTQSDGLMRASGQQRCFLIKQSRVDAQAIHRMSSRAIQVHDLSCGRQHSWMESLFIGCSTMNPYTEWHLFLFGPPGEKVQERTMRSDNTAPASWTKPIIANISIACQHAKSLPHANEEQTGSCCRAASFDDFVSTWSKGCLSPSDGN